MKIVILTTIYNQYGWEMIKTLKKNDIPVEAILVEKRTPKQKPSLIQVIWRFFWNNYRKRRYQYQDMAPVFYFERLNSEESEKKLKELSPDLLVLACAPIIKVNILATPRLGTVNAHPGILPDYKGLRSVERMLADNKNPGVSVHWVDEGIDTGQLIVKGEIEWDQSDRLVEIKEKCNQLSYKLMLKTLKELILNEREGLN